MSTPWSALTGGVIGVGVGEAAGIAIEPAFESQRQQAWKESQARVFDLGTLAKLVAQGLVELAAAEEEAARNGFTPQRLAAAVQLALVAAPVAELLELWRRGKIGPDLVRHGLAKAQIEPQYWEPLMELFVGRLDPAVVATAVQRGIMHNPNLLPVGPPTGVGVVEPMPVVDLDPVLEAQAHGVDFDRLAVLARIVGLPPAPGELLQLVNRGTIGKVDFLRGVSEGNTRNEWGEVLFTLRRRLLTPHEYVDGHLRGWTGLQAMYDGAALSGMEQADADLLFKITGRPLAYHQVLIGQRRGGVYDGPVDQIDAALLASMRQSSMRPEWYNIANAARFTLPSGFVFRSLLRDGALTAAEGEHYFLQLGWPAELATKVANAYGGGSTAAAKEETRAELRDEYEGGYLTEAEFRTALGQLGYAGQQLELEVHLGDARRIKRWREKAVDAIEAAYASFKIDDATATTELAQLNVLGDAATSLLAVWRLLRLDTIRLLTPAQVKKAYTKGLIDQATALTELDDHGYTPDDAATLLAE